MTKPNQDTTQDTKVVDPAKHAEQLDARYEELAFDLNDGDKGNFLSGWQCYNPFVSEFLLAVKERAEHIDYQKYVYLDDDDELSNSIFKLHVDLDGAAPQAVLCGSGSTPLMFAFITFLQKIGTKRIYFIPPLYFTLHIACNRYGIQAIPISMQHPFEEGFRIDLPDVESSVLLITDPVWYAGIPIADGVIEEISEWQRRTSSFVFVDGSLQYLSWSGNLSEATAGLDPALTFRLICPSKQLSVHGYRFSYILLPTSQQRRLGWVYANICGPAGADSLAFGYEAVSSISKKRIPQQLMMLASERHRYLREKGMIESALSPSCGYFVFEQIRSPLPEGYTLVDGRFFDQKNYPGYTKLNLLSPSIRMISGPPADQRTHSQRLRRLHLDSASRDCQ